ncbi:MAG: tRNA (N(6)-L-threonylcarbamoyladenosine(37)-C(2))-methylthiotransferase [Nitrososphaerota archaeon]|nr:tRNA (N(6)-L-threonylcarbamoyladenosine(37)-C(2))-methylthiotransferase [Aigarchaeota archaeon]MDW8076766.1 tRNA (N(6)-L-threonylcarbamoyladenosine(37)-C(2))-methylthiotransferase [Nitrososphaerota archaeon]
MVLKVYAEVYGCAANQADGEILLGLLEEAGFSIVNDPDEADLNVLVTCAVKKPTSDRMIERAKKLHESGKPLLVAGCMVTAEFEAIRKVAPSAIFLGPRDFYKVFEVIGSRVSLEHIHTFSNIHSKLGLHRYRKNRVIGIVPVSEGCRWARCTFCIVPIARGPFFSYPMNEVVNEARRMLEDGCREIWLTSQDMGSYGLDLGRNMLPDLINEVAGLQGKFFIRVGMMNPIYLSPILDDLITSYLNPKVFKFLHLPLQSGSAKVLRDMGRGYTPQLFKRIVEKFKTSIPELTLATDIIVGYPTETDEDFEMSIKLLDEIKPDIVNISKFYPRPGTPADKLPRLSSRVVDERSKIMTEICKELSIKSNERWVGWYGLALVDELGRYGEMVCRNTSYKPIVLNTKQDLLGKFVEVSVIDTAAYCLFGKLENVLI